MEHADGGNHSNFSAVNQGVSRNGVSQKGVAFTAFCDPRPVAEFVVDEFHHASAGTAAFVDRRYPVVDAVRFSACIDQGVELATIGQARGIVGEARFLQQSGQPDRLKKALHVRVVGRRDGDLPVTCTK